MITFIFVQISVFDFFEASHQNFYTQQLDEHDLSNIGDIKAAKGMFINLKTEASSPHFIDKSIPQRTLESFYLLRAYHGAPPVIPHPILKENTLTGDTCLACHRHGGFTPKFNAYAPVVPHPEKLNCRQCHNPQTQSSLFKQTKWRKNTGKRGTADLPGAPLTIPHSLQMRENCLACHSGPSAVEEIRTTHPERFNCLQCHVEKNTVKVWDQR